MPPPAAHRPPPPSDSGWEVGFSKPRIFLLQPQGLVRTRGLGVLLATEERILASLSFLRSGSGFREAAIVGGRAACLPPPPTTLTAPPGLQRASPEGPGPLRRAAPLCAHLAADVGLAERRACPPRRAQQAGWLPGALGRRRRPGPGAPSPWTLGRGRRLSPKVYQTTHVFTRSSVDGNLGFSQSYYLHSAAMNSHMHISFFTWSYSRVYPRLEF